MKRTTSPWTSMSIVLILTLLLGLSGTDPARAAQKRKVDQLKFPALNSFQLPGVQKAQTPQGIKLRLIKDDRLPFVNLTILLKGGSVYDPSTKVGLADVTASLLRIGGTKELNAEGLEKLLDSQGITISISSTGDYFQISLNCLKENFDSALAILSKMLQQPAFDQEKLEEIKSQQSSSIARRNDNPSGIMIREIARLIYGVDSPLAAVQEYEHLDNIATDDIMKTYLAFFAPDNMLAGVVGPLDIQELQTLFEKHFGSWKTSAKVPPFPVVKEPTFDFKVAVAEKSDINQTYLALGHLGVKENPQEKAKIEIFNSIFATGFDSRLNRRIRVKMGLTYGIFGGIFPQYLYPGQVFFGTFTKTESTLEAVNAIFDEISTIQKNLVSEKELQDAKDYFLNSHVFNYSTPEKILQRSLSNEFYGEDEEADKKFIEDVKKVTAQDVLSAAQTYLHPDKMAILLVGNEEKIKAAGDLAALGKIQKWDISIKPPALKEKIPAATPEMLAKGQEILSSLFKTTYRGYNSLKSLEVVKDSKMTMGDRSIDMGSKTIALYPDKFYVEISVMGGMMKIENIIDGKKGLRKMAGKEKPLPAEEIEKNIFGDLYDIFFPAEKGKYSFQYLKEEKLDGKTYDVIYIFDSRNHWAKFFINRETRLIEMEEKLAELPGQSGIARTVYSDFRIIKGIPFAFKSQSYVKDKVLMEESVKKVDVNPVVDMNLFKIEESK